MFNFKLTKTMRDVQWSFISLATASLSHLLLRIVLGRELGPEGLGVYTLVFTIYLFGMQFAGFGIGSALTKYVAEFSDESSKVKEYVSAGFSSSIITGVMMAIVLYLVSDFIAMSVFHIPEMGDFLKFVSFCLPFIAIQKMVLGALVGLRKMKLYALINIIQNTFIFLLSIYLVLVLNADVRGAVFGFVIPTIIISIISAFFIKDLYKITYLSFTDKFKDVAWFGFYFVLANSIGMINTQIDSLMVGHLMDATSVGIYAVAIIIIHGITLIPNSVHTAIAPPIAYHYGKGEYEKTINLIRQTMLKVFIVIFVIALVLAFFGETLIVLLFTNDFIFAYSPLLVLLIGYSIYSPVHSVDCTLLSIGKVNVIYKIALICAICNIIFNILLIPKYGILGASLATSMSIILLSILKLYFIKKYVLDLRNTLK
ncbi:flippase [Methanolobus psychrotolerans]|uniref:flippase n=1 Tax=Methanolobus psychrotolerans TaxID=1874706 RepID=UPI000B919567|nr:flippase [Methanolobus psychrotolerans]